MQINRENQQRARAARTDHLLKTPEVKLPLKRNREEISLENEDDDFDKETAVDSENSKDSESSAKEKKAANLAAAVTDALFAEQTAKIEAEAEANQNSGNSGNGGNSGNEDEETAATSLTAEEKDKIEME